MRILPVESLIIITFLIIRPTPSVGQKKVLDPSIYDSWESVNDEKISDDGKYITYIVQSPKRGSTLVAKSLNGHYEEKISAAANATFIGNSNFVIFNIGKDSLGILELGKKKVDIIEKADSYKTSQGDDNSWFAYQVKTPSNKLVVKNMHTKEQRIYTTVSDYIFSKNGQVLLLQTVIKTAGEEMYEIKWINLSTGKESVIKRSTGISTNFSFDTNAKQLAFLTKNPIDKTQYYVLNYYTLGMDSAIICVNNNTLGMRNSYTINNQYDIPYFSQDGAHLFFSIKPASPVKSPPKSPMASVNVWHYMDSKLQPQQAGEVENDQNRSFIAVIDTSQHKVVQLTDTNDLPWIDLPKITCNEYALVKTESNWAEEIWHPSSRQSIYIVSLSDGSRKQVKEHLLGEASFSRDGKYVIWYDREVQQYFSYRITDAVVQNISKKIPVPLYQTENSSNASAENYGIAGWSKDDSLVFIYDQYDIWQVDPTGITPPVNTTAGVGRTNNITFRLLLTTETSGASAPFNTAESIILTALDNENKNNGFYSLKLSNPSAPQKLLMDANLYYWPPYSTNVPLKAKNKNTYLLRRMNASEYPNIYYTSDFKKLYSVTHLKPQEEYNWLTAELIKWPALNENMASGILYKPEDFNPQKKYPVIFYFYEKESDGLNRFPHPELSSGRLDIPYFVSRDYLVFVPDIHYQVGEPGESAYNYVASAAKYLSKFSWVDSTKMGLQGHSFGGFEVNYIITRTDLFAAAISCAGASNLVSYANNIRPGLGLTTHYYTETGQGRIGATLWEKPDLYIKNSPIFKANTINTPLLLVHNEKDWAISWLQSVEFFTALRRLNKSVWMLQYDNEGHTIEDRLNQIDLTIRMGQFFDHFLKGRPATVWIQDGVPAKSKGVDTGLLLDTSGTKK